MSSAVVSTSAALSRHFVFEDEADAEASSSPGISSSRAALDRTAPSASPRAVGSGPSIASVAHVLQSTINNQKSAISLAPASRLEMRPVPAMVSSGIAELDALTGGLPRGCVTEICGAASAGRTTLLLASLMAATRRGEFCAVVDASDSLDANSAAAAGVELERLLWVRCGDSSSKLGSPQSKDTEKKNKLRNTNPVEHRLEQVLRATDLLLESGGFGMIVLDLAELAPLVARRIPLTTWFRFRRAIEHTPTILLAIEQQAIAGSCSSLLLQFSSQFSVLSSQNAAAQSIAGQERNPSHTQLLTGLEIS